MENESIIKVYLFPTNILSFNPTKWSNTLKQFVGKLPTNFLSVFDHFVGMVLKELTYNNCSKSTLDKLENGVKYA